MDPRRRFAFRRIRVLCLLAVLCAGVAPVAAETGKLASKDPVEAYRAVEEAIRTKDPSVAATLLDVGLETPHPHIAVGCGEALAAIGPEVFKRPDFLRALEKAQRTKEPEAQRNSARVLAAWGDPSIDEALAHLASGRRQPAVQAEALSMLGRLRVTKEAPFPRCVAAVAAALKSQHPTVRAAACSAAARIKDPSYAELLVDVARKAQDEYSGLYAVWALVCMERKGDLGKFVRIVESDAKRETMQACLRAVSDLSAPEEGDVLLQLSRSTRKDVRDAACLGLARLARRSAFPVREGPPPPPPAPGAPPVPPAASKVAERMLTMIELEDAWEVRDAAARVLAALGEAARPLASAKLPGLVGDTDDDVALTAMDLCGVLKIDAASRRLFEIALLDKSPIRRMFAARAVGSANPTWAAAEFLAVATRDRKVRDQGVQAVRALGYVRGEEAYRGLLDMAVDATFPEGVLAEVERSLERITGRRFGRKRARWDAWYSQAKDKDPFHPHVARFDRNKNRREAVEKRLYGLTETTERAVESGLRWFESKQHPDGKWDGNDSGLGGYIDCEPAYTGLALLSFLGAGYSGSGGKFNEAIRRATEFLAATQFYDGGFPVTGGGDSSWVFAYAIGMAVWGLTESYTLSGEEVLREPARRGIEYLVRVQTPGAGWRYSARSSQSDTSCTSWVLMALKSADMGGIPVAQKSYDGIDLWLERCSNDITGEEEFPEDMVTDYDREVGAKRYFKAFTAYRPVTASVDTALRTRSMTAVGMVCRFFMGWKRSHPYMIGAANTLMDNLPQWMKGVEIPVYHYYWYYGTLAMHQMGGRYWRAWNEKIKVMLPERQVKEPPENAGSWDPDTVRIGGGRLFSTASAVMSLETYYRFSPLMLDLEPEGGGKRPPPPADPPSAPK
jgi:hypothetical protein